MYIHLHLADYWAPSSDCARTIDWTWQDRNPDTSSGCAKATDWTNPDQLTTVHVYCTPICLNYPRSSGENAEDNIRTQTPTQRIENYLSCRSDGTSTIEGKPSNLHVQLFPCDFRSFRHGFHG